MTTSDHLPGPDVAAITTYITTTFPETDVVTIEGGSFFSLDAEKHWPNFATIVWTDEFDESSEALRRPGAFRLNIGVSRATFERLIGSDNEPDYTALDRILPHPVYARQLWLSILNPSDATFVDVVIPLLDEAHARLADARARHAGGQGSTSSTAIEPE
jgi:Family of unknown function (DUF6194)